MNSSSSGLDEHTNHWAITGLTLPFLNGKKMAVVLEREYGLTAQYCYI